MYTEGTAVFVRGSDEALCALHIVHCENLF